MMKVDSNFVLFVLFLGFLVGFAAGVWIIVSWASGIITIAILLVVLLLLNFTILAGGGQ